jgi:hypothetical protein
MHCNNPGIASLPLKFKHLNFQTKTPEIEQIGHVVIVHEALKPLRCVFCTKWRQTSSGCKWRACGVDKLQNKNA